MGVYINMEMPKSCEECRFFAWKRRVGRYCTVDDRITFHATLDEFSVGYERNGDCPLIPAPPHGDLIDRNALLEGEGRYSISLCKEGIDVEEILRAKTVIPASEEG